MDQHVFLSPLTTLIFRSFSPVPMLSLLLKLSVSASMINQTVRIISWSYGRCWIAMFVKWLLGLNALKMTGCLWAHVVRRLNNVHQIAQLLLAILLYRRLLFLLYLWKVSLTSGFLSASLCLILFHARVLYVDKFVLKEYLSTEFLRQARCLFSLKGLYLLLWLCLIA